MKKIFLIVTVLLFCVSFTYAADADWDCKLVLSKDVLLSDWDSVDENDIVKTNISTAIPKKFIEKAFDNLRLYCCDMKKLSSGYCSRTNDDTLYPQSIYLFDHILDVYLRRLDAKQQNDNWNDLLYGLEPDWSWLEWREFITKRGNEVNWSLPLEIQKMYEKYWKNTQQQIPTFMEMNGAVQGNRETEVESAIKLYENRTLFDKYNLACDVGMYVSNLVYLKNVKQSQRLSTDEYNKCKNLTNARINNEYIYVKILLMQKWEKLLWSNMDAYLGTYFVSSKLSELMKTVFSMSTAFSEINKAVVQLVPQCS